MSLNYQIGEPTPAPKGNGFTKFHIICIGLIFFLFTWFFGAKPMYDEYKSKWKEAEHDTILLAPGWHWIEIFPFIEVVPPGHVGVLKKNFSGNTEYNEYQEIHIPQGHIGIMYDNRGSETKILKPGFYPIDLDRYTVHLKGGS